MMTTDEIRDGFRKLRDAVQAHSIFKGSESGQSDEYGVVERLLDEAGRLFADAEHRRRKWLGRCQRCFHSEGSHVDDSDPLAETKYNCQVECCSCPEYVRRTEK